MSALELRHEPDRHVEIVADGARLWRYVYFPDTPLGEAPRPYAHPVASRAGDVLTNFRPNDHPWHHALSLTLASVDGVNFWGGPSYRAGEGYAWREDQGRQVHRGWRQLSPERLEHEVDWLRPGVDEAAAAAQGRSAPAGGVGETEVLLRERRRLETSLLETGGWALHWTSELRNVSGRELTLGNYHASGGLVGSHYTGLQFRGARDLLDEHGDARIGLAAEGGLAGEAAIHGTPAHWVEWSCQHDTSLRRTRIRFENVGGPLPWFVRAKNPLLAFAFHREHPHGLADGAVLRLEHRLSFTPA